MEADSNSKDATLLCEECKSNPSKYKCPGCYLRTCSLPCINSHKQRTACTGKRPAVECIPLSEFDHNIILSDYNFLEDTKRMADSSKRLRAAVCDSHFRVPPNLKYLRIAASRRKIKLLFLPKGMAKRELNQTYYNHRKKSIIWTIEWRFHSTNVVIVDHRLHESKTLCSAVENHLKPGPWKHALKQFSDHPRDSLKLFICRDSKRCGSPFRQLNIMSSIRDQLANLVILEYPVIHIFLPSHSCDFDIIHSPTKAMIPPPPWDHYPPSPIGVMFREEEIEDDGWSVDPLESDHLIGHHSHEVVNHVEENQEGWEYMPSADCSLFHPEAAIGDSNIDEKSVVQFGIDDDLEEGEIR